jgi:uncharacterized protein (DUF1810 family)
MEYDLDRFVHAQEEMYPIALAEIRNGHKETHWMWFIFPQIDGLGMSALAKRYAIAGLDEARAYLAHPTLGPRLVECTQAVLALNGRTVREIFGTPDDLKLRSAATLFAAASEPHSIFHQLLAKYFDGGPDERTLRLLAAGR